jgi:hypothetical protein
MKVAHKLEMVERNQSADGLIITVHGGAKGPTGLSRASRS